MQRSLTFYFYSFWVHLCKETRYKHWPKTINQFEQRYWTLNNLRYLGVFAKLKSILFWIYSPIFLYAVYHHTEIMFLLVLYFFQRKVWVLSPNNLIVMLITYLIGYLVIKLILENILKFAYFQSAFIMLTLRNLN